MKRAVRVFEVVVVGVCLASCAAIVGLGPVSHPAAIAAANAIAADPQGMTQAEVALLNSRLEAVEANQRWLWLASGGVGLAGSAGGSYIALRRTRPRSRTGPSPAEDRSFYEQP